MTDGDKIKAVRKAAKLSQEKFGKELGVTKSHISGAETGAKNLSSSVLELLKIKYRVSSSWWETEEGDIFTSELSTSETGKADYPPIVEAIIGQVLTLTEEEKGEAYALLAKYFSGGDRRGKS